MWGKPDNSSVFLPVPGLTPTASVLVKLRCTSQGEIHGHTFSPWEHSGSWSGRVVLAGDPTEPQAGWGGSRLEVRGVGIGHCSIHKDSDT